MRIAEIFRSIQGEGRLTGTESIFVRTSGCNLRCRFCDTPYASWSPEGEHLSVAEILDRIEHLRQSQPPAWLNEWQGITSGAGVSPAPAAETAAPQSTGAVRHVIITGGEPMIFADLMPLCDELHDRGWHITIETSGTLYLPVACDLISISPKLANSAPPAEVEPIWARRHALHRHVPEVIRRLTTEYDYQLKFVIDAPNDCREVEGYLSEFPAIERGSVLLMPQGVDTGNLAEKRAWLEPYCRQQGFQFCPRRHIEWFGHQRER